MDLFNLSPPIVAALLQGLVTLVWVTLASSYCQCHGTAQPQGTLLKLFRFLAWLFAAHYFSKLLVDLIPSPDPNRTLFDFFCWIAEITMIGILPVLRHLIPLGTLGSPAPSRLWLTINYGLGIVVLSGMRLRETLPVDPWSVYFAGFAALVLWDLVVLAKARRRPVIMADLGFRGYLIFAVALFSGVLILISTERLGTTEQSLVWTLSHAFVGFAAAVPFALRVLGEVLRGLLLNGLRFTLVGGIYSGLRTLGPVAEHAGWAVDLLGIAVVVYVLGPGNERFTEIVDALVLRHGRQWRQQLRTAAYDLSPEKGLRATCRDAAAAVAEILHMRGAAVLLDGDPEPVIHGDFPVGPVVDAWPRGKDLERLPRSTFDLLWLRDPKLQQAMLDAQVAWVVPIVSARRRWGQLLVSAGALGNAIDHGKLKVLEDFTRELALVLDAAHLTGRVRTAERELARSEKLAALGETAARIAHEIRNPVTAARSLSQQIAEEPVSQLNEEHAALVVRELDRVECQVRSLLQFAHQETYTFRPLRVHDLVADTVADLRATPLTKGVDLQLIPAPEMETGLEIVADGEGLRQVLVNLVHNAVDAVRNSSEPRRVTVELDRHENGVDIRARDSGPGVADELLPRIFDPFVSAKAQGTGLGLAISKRIVEAHGGSIHAEADPAGGMVFHIRLPIDARYPDAHRSRELPKISGSPLKAVV